MKNTNCLALTIRKEYHLTVVKNVATKCIILSTKVLFSILMLNFIHLFV